MKTGNKILFIVIGIITVFQIISIASRNAPNSTHANWNTFHLIVSVLFLVMIVIYILKPTKKEGEEYPNDPGEDHSSGNRGGL